MTYKKEIIIDGVDVSKCTHIDNWKHCNCCNDLIKTIYPKATKCHIEEDLRCEIYLNCYFKQLKRKEQECEKLKKEQAEIKKYLGISSKTIMERLEELQEFRDIDKDKLYQAEQALDEIEKTCLFKIENRQFVLPNVWQHFLDVINKAKDNNYE